MSKPGTASRASRFKAGTSGNPRGRPRRKKEPKTGSPFDILRDRRVTVQIDGVDRELSLDQALLQRTYQDGLNGDSMAIRTILKAIAEIDALRTPARRLFPLITSEYPHPADIDLALLILNIACQIPERTRDDDRPFLKLEPWAVNSALARLKRSFWSEKVVQDLKENTHNPDEVEWPQGAGA